MFFANPLFYYISIGLQAICVIHCMRRGNQQKWIWIIVFLPVVGCIAYIFTEMVSRRQISDVQEGVGVVFNSVGRIKRLEDNLRFTDTFNNRIALADAYIAAGQTDKAIALYEQSMTGAFTENELLLTRLITAYYKVERYADIIPLAQKLYKSVTFARSRAHILYTLALENTGRHDLAEKEFATMKARFSNFEARYNYGMFLRRAGRDGEAKTTFTTMLEEAPHLSRRERRSSSHWFAYAKEELGKMKL